jgi:hypothetical protein
MCAVNSAEWTAQRIRDYPFLSPKKCTVNQQTANQPNVIKTYHSFIIPDQSGHDVGAVKKTVM